MKTSPRCSMLAIWLLLLTATSSLCIEVTETIEDIDPPPRPSPLTPNRTILHPVSNSTNSTKDQVTIGSKYDTTLWKASSSSEGDSTKSEEDSNITASKEQGVVERPGNSTFRPSQFFESFLESLDSKPTRPTEPFTPVLKKPPSSFKGSPNDDFKPFNKIPKGYLPYKLESPILTKTKSSWKPTAPSLQESRPTVEMPVRVPAGGLYQINDPFKDKPGTDGDDEDFGLEFNGGEIKHQMRKHVNPWSHLIRLATALIPVGIIFSALTPNIITVHPGPEHLPTRIYRRSTGVLPAISERCRRRLLCELQADQHYARSTNLASSCRRIRCEDPEALSRSLHWLLNYHKTVTEDNG